MAPTQHIGRHCKRIALIVLVRGELSVFLNPKLFVGGVFRSVFERAIFARLERNSSAFPTATNKGATIICRELRTVGLNAQVGRLSSTLRVEHYSVLSGGPGPPVRSFFACVP